MSLFYITGVNAWSAAKPRPSRVVKAAAEAWCRADYNREKLAHCSFNRFWLHPFTSLSSGTEGYAAPDPTLFNYSLLN